VLALATVVLALSTLSLYRQTRVLAQIETKRDLRSNLERRIQLGDTIVHTNSYMILNPLKDETGLARVQITKEWSWVRELRHLIPYQEGQSDNEIFQILPLHDLLIIRMDKEDAGEKAIENPEDEKAVNEWVNRIQSLLRILVARWRSQLPYLYP
jgi:cell division protein FtsX